MTYNEIFKELQDEGVPLADIKVIFDGYFKVDFNRLGIIGNDDKVSNQEYNDLIAKIKEGYPIAYLVGYTDILSLHILLNEDTLIPRIETADFIYSYIRDNYDFNYKKILDLCTGSGFIAIALKKYFPSSFIDASDISDNALQIAKQSALLNNKEINFIKSDFLKDIDSTYDVIICNPPYIEENNKDVDAPFEPALALYSGKDGLDSYRNIFSKLDSHLNKDGIAFFEMESTNVENTVNLFKNINKNEYEIKVIKDLYDRERFLEVKKIIHQD